MATIPAELLKNRYWRGTLHLFLNHGKLNCFLNSGYFELDNYRIYGDKLKKMSAPWSQSEKFMLNLALHLFNERFKVNLSDMDYLDPINWLLKLSNFAFLNKRACRTRWEAGG